MGTQEQPKVGTKGTEKKPQVQGLILPYHILWAHSSDTSGDLIQVRHHEEKIPGAQKEHRGNTEVSRLQLTQTSPTVGWYIIFQQRGLVYFQTFGKYLKLVDQNKLKLCGWIAMPTL